MPRVVVWVSFTRWLLCAGFPVDHLQPLEIQLRSEAENIGWRSYTDVIPAAV